MVDGRNCQKKVPNYQAAFTIAPRARTRRRQGPLARDMCLDIPGVSLSFSSVF